MNQLPMTSFADPPFDNAGGPEPAEESKSPLATITHRSALVMRDWTTRHRVRVRGRGEVIV